MFKLVSIHFTFSGMVAQCAGCNVFQPWAALLIGLFAGLVFHGVSTAMIKGGLDDPLDAVAVHGGGGILGVLCVPFFSYGTGIFWAGNTTDAWKALGKKKQDFLVVNYFDLGVKIVTIAHDLTIIKCFPDDFHCIKSVFKAISHFS